MRIVYMINTAFRCWRHVFSKSLANQDHRFWHCDSVAWPRSTLVASKHWLMYLLLISFSASCFPKWWMTRQRCPKLERCSGMITEQVIGLPLHLINALVPASHKYADSHQGPSPLNNVQFLRTSYNHWGKNLLNKKKSRINHSDKVKTDRSVPQCLILWW